MEPISIAIVRRELRLALSGPAGVNTVLDLTVDGKVYPAIVKELQRHPVRRNVSTSTSSRSTSTKRSPIAIPVRLEGEAKAVIDEGGLVDPAVDTIEVRTTPRNIPNEIVIDITDMTMDTVITLGDIKLPAGVTAVADPDMAVVTVLVTRGEEVEEPRRGRGRRRGRRSRRGCRGRCRGSGRRVIASRG